MRDLLVVTSRFISPTPTTPLEDDVVDDGVHTSPNGEFIIRNSPETKPRLRHIPCLTAGCSLLAGHVLQAVLDWRSLLATPLPFLVHEVDDNRSSTIFFSLLTLLSSKVYHDFCTGMA